MEISLGVRCCWWHTGLLNREGRVRAPVPLPIFLQSIAEVGLASRLGREDGGSNPSTLTSYNSDRTL